jgi:hypothetical protein
MRSGGALSAGVSSVCSSDGKSTRCLRRMGGKLGTVFARAGLGP